MNFLVPRAPSVPSPSSAQRPTVAPPTKEARIQDGSEWNHDTGQKRPESRGASSEVEAPAAPAGCCTIS